MKTENETKSLKAGLIERFRSADAEHSENERKAAEITARETEERFIAFFGQKPERVEGSKAFFEGVGVQRNCGYGGGWQVIQYCPKCKNEVISTAKSTFEELGRVLSEKLYCHNCLKSNNAVRSADDVLLDALRDFVSENCQCD